jgi:hypothetical protein
MMADIVAVKEIRLTIYVPAASSVGEERRGFTREISLLGRSD